MRRISRDSKAVSDACGGNSKAASGFSVSPLADQLATALWLGMVSMPTVFRSSSSTSNPSLDADRYAGRLGDYLARLWCGGLKLRLGVAASALVSWNLDCAAGLGTDYQRFSRGLRLAHRTMGVHRCRAALARHAGFGAAGRAVVNPFSAEFSYCPVVGWSRDEAVVAAFLKPRDRTFRW